MRLSMEPVIWILVPVGTAARRPCPSEREPSQQRADRERRWLDPVVSLVQHGGAVDDRHQLGSGGSAGELTHLHGLLAHRTATGMLG